MLAEHHATSQRLLPPSATNQGLRQQLVFVHGAGQHAGRGLCGAAQPTQITLDHALLSELLPAVCRWLAVQLTKQRFRGGCQRDDQHKTAPSQGIVAFKIVCRQYMGTAR
jgi:hypothetical protein